MNTAPLSILDDERMIRDGEHAVDRYNKAQQHQRNEVLPMARGLLAARRKYPADRDFGDWLFTSSYREIGDTDRAALIKIGEHHDMAMKVISFTRFTSPRAIWDAIEELLPVSPVGKPIEVPPSPVESAPPPASAPEIAEPPADSKPPEPVRVNQRSRLHDLPRVAEVLAIYPQKDTRRTLSNLCAPSVRGRIKIWNLILEAIDLGLVPMSNAAITITNLRLLVPGAHSTGFCAKFDLTSPKDRATIRDELFPIMAACREQILARPERIGEIIADYQNAERARTTRAAQEQTRQQAINSLKPGQSEITIFGKMVWPRLDPGQGEYDYDQIRAAVWAFRDLDDWNKQITGDNSVGSRAIRIRLSTKWYGEYLLRTADRSNRMARIFSLLQYITRLMEQNPDGECKWPHYPTTEAEW